MFVLVRSASLGVAVAFCGCGALETPSQQTARQTSDLAAVLTAHLQTLPHVASASVVVHASESNPVLIPEATTACDVRIAAILSLTDVADATTSATTTAANISQAARSHIATITPNSCPPMITVVPSAARAPNAYAKVGPFEVAAASKRPLQLALACLLLVIGALLMRLRRARA